MSGEQAACGLCFWLLMQRLTELASACFQVFYSSDAFGGSLCVAGLFERGNE